MSHGLLPPVLDVCVLVLVVYTKAVPGYGPSMPRSIVNVHQHQLMRNRGLVPRLSKQQRQAACLSLCALRDLRSSGLDQLAVPGGDRRTTTAAPIYTDGKNPPTSYFVESE